MRYIMFLMGLFLSEQLFAHQWVPTYPKLEPSYIDGVLKVRMELFNSRQDVNFYELGVFDKDFNPVKFATTDRIIKVDYLKRQQVEIFIREQDRDVAVYVCSKSKLISTNQTATIVSSKICSKIK
jgi:hypothetical protein